MDQEFYRTLISKFCAEEISDGEINVLEEWLKESEVNRKIFDEENELWHKASIKTRIDHFKTDKAWSGISKKLGISESKGSNIVLLKRNNYKILIAAASLAFLVAIGVLSLWLIEKSLDKQRDIASTMISTDEGEKARILLPDSTQVIMNSVSTLEYTGAYNNKERVVTLAGEAFFDVRTNAEKPFYVQLGKMTVVATGTRFNVFAYKNEDRIETTLEEGNIQIVINGQETFDVKAGQHFIFITKTNKVIIRDVAPEINTAWKENKLRLIETPFEEALRKIARKYNVIFEIRDRDLLELKYTATFIDEPIEDVMQMLKTISPITYKIYNRTTINDKQYLKPKIIVGKSKNFNLVM